MTVTSRWGMQYQALLDVGFQQNVFALGGYTTTTTRTNLVPNPSFETNTTSWTIGAGSTLTRTNAQSAFGTWSVSGTRTSTTGNISIQSSPRFTIAAGNTYTFSLFFRRNYSTTRTTSLRMLYYDSASVLLQTTTVAQTVPAQNTWGRMSMTTTAPANAVTVFVDVLVANAIVGETIFIDGVLLETGSSVLPYFDGTVADPYTGYTLLEQAWNGTTNNSTSTATWGLNSSIYGSTLDGPDALDGVTSFVDITEYVQNININRGRSTQLDVFNAGTLNLQANDQQSNRSFDPLNTASPWYQGNLGIAPRRKIKIVAGTADIFNGFIYDLDIIYDEPDLSFAQISAVDALAQLSQTTLDTFIPPNELSSSRITTILNRPEIGFGTAVAPREISPSISSCGTVAYEAGTNTLQALQEVQIAENGRFFVTRTGALRFDERVQASFATAIATLGGTATGAIPITALENVYGAETVVNRVSVQIAGSNTTSVVNGTASQALYGTRSLALSNLPLINDAAGSALAQDLVSTYQNPEVRFTGATINLNALSTAQQNLVAAFEIGDVLVVSKEFAAGSPTTVNQTVVIEAVRHTISANSHNINLSLAPFSLLYQLILDDPEFGKLSTTNALGELVLQDFVMDISEVDANYTFT